MKNKGNMNIREYNMCLNEQSWKKASNIIMHEYKNIRQREKIFKEYLISGKIR